MTSELSTLVGLRDATTHEPTVAAAAQAVLCSASDVGVSLNGMEKNGVVSWMII